MRLGAHISIARGISYLVNRQVEIGGNCGQMFVGSPRTWSVSSFTTGDGSDFLERRDGVDQHPYVVHATYLINLASPDEELRYKSVDCLQRELDASARLHADYVVVHPGAHTGSGRANGVARVGESLDRLSIPEDVTLLLENTAGGGTTLGSTFEELRTMIDRTSTAEERLGVCIDTCHAHAAGYELTGVEGFRTTVDRLDTELGTDTVHVLHLNDSKDECGSRKDHHEHIGEGYIGIEGFRSVINADCFAELPMVIETPKDDEASDPRNIARLKLLRE